MRNLVILSFVIAALSACGGGGGGKSETPKDTPSAEAPKSNSIADLAAFAKGGTNETYTDRYSATYNTKTRSYTDANGKVVTVSLKTRGDASDTSVGALTKTIDGKNSYMLVGIDETKNVNADGYYVGDFRGKFSDTKTNQSFEVVNGYASLTVNAADGTVYSSIEGGPTVYEGDADINDHVITYFNVDNPSGKITGNHVTFDGSKSTVGLIYGDGKNETHSLKTDSEAVFSKDGKTAYGYLTSGKNDLGLTIEGTSAITKYSGK